MKAKAKRFEFAFGAIAAILVMWIGSAIFSSPAPPAGAATPAVPAPAPAPTPLAGERWHAPAAVSSELRVWDPEDVEFFELPRPASSGATHGYYQFPSYRNGVLIFVSEGDIWRAPAGLAGGLASRLTSRGFAAGSVVDTELSPDGRMVAFSATVDGGREAFVMPVSGGAPQRLTYGEGALVRGWASSTVVLATSRAYSDLPDERIVSIDVGTGQHTVHEVSQACDGVVEQQTGCLFFTRVRQSSKTKRYMGGTAEKLWRYCPGDAEALALTADFDGTDRSPMLFGGRVYFLSDRSGVMNIWSMSTDGSDKRAVTDHTCYGVAEASVGEGGDGIIVYRSGGSLFSLALGQPAGAAATAGDEIDITLLTDRAQMQEHWVNGRDWLSWSSVSPDGSRVAMISRGVLFTAPVPVGTRKHKVGSRLVQVAPNITNGGGQRFEAATWVNDTHLLAVADTAPAGELGFFLAPGDGLGSIQEIGGPADAETVGFGRGGNDMILSPDGSLIVWTDHEARMWLAALSDPTERTLLAEGVTFAPFGGSPATFSPDSTHLAINMNTRQNMAAIFIYKIATDDSPAEGPTQLTEGHSNCWNPVWTPSALFFLSDRELHNEVGSPWGARGSLPKFSSTGRIYAIPLQSSSSEQDAAGKLFIDEPTELSPWPETAERFNCSADAPFTTSVDLGEISELRKLVRVVPTVEASDIDSLASFGCGSALLFTKDGGLMAAPLTSPFSEEASKPFTVVPGVRAFEVTVDGAVMTMGARSAVQVGVASSVSALRGLKMQEPVGLESWMIALQPQLEWMQLYRDAWRMMRDYFYDPGMNGNDWDMMRERYEALLPRVGTRDELDDVISQLVAELCALHVFISPARDAIGEPSPHARMASLGATLERDVSAGGYVVTRVFHQEPDLAASKAASPLDRPLCSSPAVPAGSVIEAINGVPLLSLPSPGFALRNQAGHQLRLTVRYATDLDISTDIVVAPLSMSEFDDLRYSDWEAKRRAIVEETGGGRIGYIHVRSTSGSAYTDFARQFFPVFDREALIIDVRHNNGGNQDSWMIEQLRHNVWMFFQERYGSQSKEASWNTQMAFRGHMVALCNENTKSDGEAFIAGFQENELGTVIGVRTWGGEIWLSRDNGLVDGGIASAPEMGGASPTPQCCTSACRTIIFSTGLHASSDPPSILPTHRTTGSTCTVVGATRARFLCCCSRVPLRVRPQCSAWMARCETPLFAPFIYIRCII
jgi:tricorn protease